MFPINSIGSVQSAISPRFVGVADASHLPLLRSGRKILAPRVLRLEIAYEIYRGVGALLRRERDENAIETRECREP